MDAVEYLNTAKRMCDTYVCGECPIGDFDCCGSYRKTDNPEEIISTVEKWAAEHPKKTRKSELLKMFPNIADNNGDIVLCPKVVDQNYECRCGETTCAKCMDEYWLSEVEEDDDEHS